MHDDYSPDTVFVASEAQVSCSLDQEAAILQLDQGVYYSLDPVGARVWELLKQPITIATLRDHLCAEYDVDAARCEQDLRLLLKELVDAGLIEVRK
jgi:hypothetical protein